MKFKAMRRMKRVKRIIVHHSESDFGSAKQFHDWHLAKGWAGVGYHFVIGNGNGADDGEIQIGRLALYQGAHCRGQNSDSIGICLVGSFTSRHPSEKQLAALEHLIATLCDAYKLDPNGEAVITGHRDWNETSCPGDMFYSLLPAIRTRVGDLI